MPHGGNRWDGIIIGLSTNSVSIFVQYRALQEQIEGKGHFGLKNPLDMIYL